MRRLLLFLICIGISHSLSYPDNNFDFSISPDIFTIMEDITNIFFIGNPGVGKSFLCNLLGANFTSGISIGQGITKKLQIFPIPIIINNEIYRIIDAPGLFENEKTTKENAKQIIKGLELDKPYKIVFVITLEGGRLRFLDIQMIQRITQSIEYDIDQIGIIINKIDNNVFVKVKDIIHKNFLYKYLINNGLTIKKENIIYIPELHSIYLNELLKGNTIYKPELHSTYIKEFLKKNIIDLLTTLKKYNITVIKQIDTSIISENDIKKFTDDLDKKIDEFNEHIQYLTDNAHNENIILQEQLEIEKKMRNNIIQDLNNKIEELEKQIKKENNENIALLIKKLKNKKNWFTNILNKADSLIGEIIDTCDNIVDKTVMIIDKVNKIFDKLVPTNNDIDKLAPLVAILL